MIRLKDLVLGRDGAAFDTKTGRTYRLNPSGQMTLRLLQEGKDAADVVLDLAAHYGQHAAVVAVGTEAFLGQLRRYLP
jgi:hypothetical protein